MKQSFEFEAWFDCEYPQDETGARPKYQETFVLDLMRSAWDAAMNKGAVRFAGLILKAHRNDGYPGDVDGDVLQKAALDCGLIEAVTMSERCGAFCSCAETISDDEWPTVCYVTTEAGKAAIEAAKEDA